MLERGDFESVQVVRAGQPDLRAAPGRNDAEFEKLMDDLRPSWLRSFKKVGVLVKSTVGALQIRRYARTDGIERLISSDESVLYDHLLS